MTCKICKKDKHDGEKYPLGWICDDCMDRIAERVAKKNRKGVTR